MATTITDPVHVAGTLARAGILRPSRLARGFTGHGLGEGDTVAMRRIRRWPS